MQPIKKYDLEERLLQFAVSVINLIEDLPDGKISNYLGSQLLRSGTSPALNYGEAQAAESKKDFVHKLKIILKELRETCICLTILQHKSLIKNTDVTKENKELIAIFSKSIETAEGNLDNS